MRSLFTSMLILGLIGPMMSQSLLYSENFNASVNSFTLNTSDMGSLATGGSNLWTVNNSFTGGNGSITCLGFPFTFTIPNTPTQPTGIQGNPNSQYLHIVSAAAVASGVNNCCFSAADGLCALDENNFARMTTDINTLNATDVTLKFWWLCAGSVSNYGEVYYSTDQGITWTLVSAPVAQYYNQLSWTQQTIANPAFEGHATLRFGFRFVNQQSLNAADPGFGIDDIEVRGNTCAAVATSQTQEICNGESFFAGGALQTISGTYIDTLQTWQACDSVVTTDLVVTTLDTAVLQQGTMLTSLGAADSYQWLNCADNSLVPNAVGQVFTPAQSGQYAVVLTSGNGCADTSSCYTVIYAGLAQVEETAMFTIYSSPGNDQLLITPQNLQESYTYTLYTLTGDIVEAGIGQGRVELSLAGQSKGIYLLRVGLDAGQVVTYKIIR